MYQRSSYGTQSNAQLKPSRFEGPKPRKIGTFLDEMLNGCRCPQRTGRIGRRARRRRTPPARSRDRRDPQILRCWSPRRGGDNYQESGYREGESPQKKSGEPRDFDRGRRNEEVEVAEGCGEHQREHRPSPPAGRPNAHDEQEYTGEGDHYGMRRVATRPGGDAVETEIQVLTGSLSGSAPPANPPSIPAGSAPSKNHGRSSRVLRGAATLVGLHIIRPAPLRCRRPYCITIPPSTAMVCPVT